MSRLRLVETDERPPGAARDSRGQRGQAGAWRRLTSRYRRWQAAVAEAPRFEPLRARPVRRALVVAFAVSVAVTLTVFWTQGLWTGWLNTLTAAVVLVLAAVIIVAARGVTALPEHQLDERQLRVHRRLVTRAFWAVMFVLLAITLVLPELIDERVIRPLDGGQVFALPWGLALLGGMTGICIEAWHAPTPEKEERSTPHTSPCIQCSGTSMLPASQPNSEEAEMPDTIDERELFSRRYESTAPDALWSAVKRALATMDLRSVDDAERTAQFSTGVSLTSWGQNMLAAVSGGAEGSTLAVRGRPKGSLLTTKLGEDRHVGGVKRRIVDAVEAQPSCTVTWILQLVLVRDVDSLAGLPESVHLLRRVTKEARELLVGPQFGREVVRKR